LLINQEVPEMRTVSKSCVRPLCWLSIAAAALGSALAAEVTVNVTDRSGDAVPDVAVYFVPTGDTVTAISAGVPGSASMEQVNNTFVPYILVVETGTEVDFPNNDTVSHHVYSFSEPKSFQLDLYRGNIHPPQLFDEPGLVVLGCNIHDGMLAFILVVDTPWSSITNASGTSRLAGLPAGSFDLFVWTPRANPEDLPIPQSIVVGDAGMASVSVQLTGKLSPALHGAAGSLSWERY
jgi:plastocyanin